MPLYAPAAAGGSDPKNITTSGVLNDNPIQIASTLAALGSQAGQYRNYFDNYGCFNSQGWLIVSGIFNDHAFNAALGVNQIELVYPGATKVSPRNYTGNAINGGTGAMIGVSNDIAGPNVLLQDNIVRTGNSTVKWATPVSAGSGYGVGNTLTTVGGTFAAGPFGVAATLVVTSVDANGGVTGVSVGATGLYTFTTPGGVFTPSIPPNPCSVTGGAGTGATFALATSFAAQNSRHIEALDYTQTIRWSLEGDGTQIFGNALARQDFVKSRTTWGLDPVTPDTLFSDGYLKSNKGLVSPGFDQHGNASLISLTRAIPAAVASTVDIGTIAFTFGGPQPAHLQIAVATSQGSAFYDLMLVWQAGTAADGGGGAAYAGAWVIVPPANALFQASPANLFDLDVQQIVASGDIILRLRTVAGTAADTASIVIKKDGPTGLSSFTPSTTVNAGVAVPTRYWTVKAKSKFERRAFGYSVPVTSGTVTIAEGTPVQVIDPAGTLAALTVSLPPNPTDGQTQRICFAQAISSLFWTSPGAATSNAPATVSAGQGVEFMYRAANFKWYRIA